MKHNIILCSLFLFFLVVCDGGSGRNIQEIIICNTMPFGCKSIFRGLFINFQFRVLVGLRIMPDDNPVGSIYVTLGMHKMPFTCIYIYRVTHEMSGLQRRPENVAQLHSEVVPRVF